MKKRVFVLLLILACIFAVAQEIINQNYVYNMHVEQSFRQNDELLMEIESFKLYADSGSLMHDIDIQLCVLKRNQTESMPGNMVNTTGDLVEAYRLLPNGEHFSSPAMITLPYDFHKIPVGYTAEDVYSYFYDTEVGHWTQLERMSVDTINHTVTSYTTHFTDFANAVIKTPEMPEANAFVPTAMTDLPDVNPLQGIPMIAAPQANNRGTVELTYPIELPKGRRGLQPNVDLHYSSAGGNGVLGVGWSIQTPAITIDTRWGVPRYSIAEETEAYLVNGEQVCMHDEHGEVIPLPNQGHDFVRRKRGNVRFYARDLRNQDYIMRYGNAANDYYWTSIDRSGTTYYYGYDPFENKIDTNAILVDGLGHIAEWALTAVVDVYGNWIRYSYINDNNEELYLDNISYTGNLRTGLAPTYSVEFNYHGFRNDVIQNARLGFLRQTRKKLCSINVLCGASPIASYWMEYESCSVATLFKTRLKSVTKYDACSVEYCEPNNLKPASWRVYDAQRPEKMVDYEERFLLVDASYGDTETPGSKTIFSYFDALPANLLFEQGKTLPSLPDLGRNIHFQSGGGIALTYGLGTGNTHKSIGLNSDINYGLGLVKATLIDLNGDGLPDYVYETAGRVYYKRQLSNGTFADSVLIPGISRIIRDQSISYSVGLQFSFMAKLKGSPLSFNNSFTDTYLADINNDHLPDLITDAAIYYNRLDENGDPTFIQLADDDIPVSTLNCERSVARNGEVDPRIECQMEKRPRESVEWNYLYSGAVVEKKEDVDGAPTYQGDVYEYTNNWARMDIAKISSFAREVNSNRIIPLDRDTIYDSAIYPIEKPIPEDDLAVCSGKKGEILFSYPNLDLLIDECERKGYVLEEYAGGLKVYELIENCNFSDSIPKADVVRVWVADSHDTINLSSTINFSDDMAEERQQSRYADGVKYYVQLSSGVIVNADGTLSSTKDSILFCDSIEADDGRTKFLSKNNIQVSPGDVLMFRLSARNNHSYDNIEWRQHIVGRREERDSKDDFFCLPSEYFSAPQDGEAIIDVDIRNNQNEAIELLVCNNTEVFDSLLISQDSAQLHLQTSVSRGDSVRVLIRFDSEPQWAKISVLPSIRFVSDFSGESGLGDTIKYIIGASIVGGPSHIAFPLDTSAAKYRAYSDLFGVLHHGWGQFAYNNVNNESIINLSELSNYFSTLSTMIADSTTLDGMLSSWHNRDSLRSVIGDNYVWEQLDDYDVFSDNRRWLPMHADLQSHKWIVAGNIGALGELEHSVCLQPVAGTNSAIMGSGQQQGCLPLNDGSPIKHMRKSAMSYSPNLSVSISDRDGSDEVSSWHNAGNLHVSAGVTWAEADFMDLNGDGYPDYVGCPGKSFNVQYTTPWGGLSGLTIKDWKRYISSSFSEGAGYSGSVTSVKRQSGNNIKNNNTYNLFELGESASQSFVNVTYMDVNADGLPDMLHQENNSVRYNLGYSFSPQYDVPHMQINTALNEHGVVSDNVQSIIRQEDLAGYAVFGLDLLNVSFSFELEQKSISGGLSTSCSKNSTTSRMLDINGDGYLDQVNMLQNGSLRVCLNQNGNNLQNEVVMRNDMMNSSTTYNFTTSAAFTVGASPVLVNPQIAPISVSYSVSNMEWIDMNGDGFVDLVVKNNPEDQPVVFYNANGTIPVNHIKQVTNPTGQTLHMTYTQSEPTVHHAGRSWLLHSVCDSLPHGYGVDTRAEMIRDYSYKDANYDTYEKSDYGYHEVITTDVLHHNPYRILHQEYANEYFINHGDLLKDSLVDDRNQPYIVNTYKTVFADNDDRIYQDLCSLDGLYRKEDHMRTYYYEGNHDSVIITASFIEYDRLHNLIARHDSGDVAIPTDDVHQYISYAPIQKRNYNQISLPISERIEDGNMNTLRFSEMEYNKYGSPSEVWNGGHSGNVVTRLYYDIYGNVMRYVSPENANGERVSQHYAYDSQTQTYPIFICNQFGETQLTKYDVRFGVPLLVVDPTGHAIQYKYDPMGRLVDVIAPNENSELGTIHYTYVLPFHKLNRNNHDYSYPHVSKMMFYQSSRTGMERTFYDARGAELQKKVWQNVNGQDVWVTQGISTVDHLGRTTATTIPFVSPNLITEYDSVVPPMVFGGRPSLLDTVAAVPRTIVKYDILDRQMAVFHPDGEVMEYCYGFARDCQGNRRFAHGCWDENRVYSEQLISPQGWVIQQNNPLGQTTSFTYNALGERLSATDADGYTTTYEYDMLGRLVRRVHPDAGETTYGYDNMGNVITKMTESLRQIMNKPIIYSYLFNRLIDVTYPIHSDLDVAYYYYSTGRIARREDATGREEFDYDPLGNVRHSRRAVFVPTERTAFLFEHDYLYDSFGKMQRITYPDNDTVTYHYYESGQLDSIERTNNGHPYPLVKQYLYDEYGRKRSVLYGNNVRTDYTYSPYRNWLINLRTCVDFNKDTLQNISYRYDAVGNIKSIIQHATDVYGLGGQYHTDYSYNDLGQLTAASCSGLGLEYELNVSMSPAGRLGRKSLSFHDPTLNSCVHYGYDNQVSTHQPRVLYDSIPAMSLDLFWDDNGNLAQVSSCKQDYVRSHVWDEENRLRAMLSPGRSGYYGYDGNGERIYKLVGNTQYTVINASLSEYGMIFDDLTVYPSPYMVLSSHGYTKHFYSGTERIATLLGEGGLVAPKVSLDSLRCASVVHGWYSLSDALQTMSVSGCTQNKDIAGNYVADLQYGSTSVGLSQVQIIDYIGQSLDSILLDWQTCGGGRNDVFFTHPDHLGSASWITDKDGLPVQYIHYAPYGEFVANQQKIGYDERFKFTGKERDGESGYDYFGARYYDHRKGFWNSVDPLADKYPHVTPYLYCNGNPVMLVDLYGEEPVTPAPVKLLGTPEYYKFRQEDYAKRHPGATHFYYEPYGLVNCTLFLSDETKSKLSQEGQVWDEQVAWGLASRLEKELTLRGDNASQFEENQSAFNNFVYGSHVKAYMNENKQELRTLSFNDLMVIVGTPSINHLIGSHEARLSILKIGYYLLLNSTDETMTLLRENLLFSDVMHNLDTPWTIPATE